MGAILAPFPIGAAHAQTKTVAVDAKPLGSALVDLAIQANISISTPRGGFGGQIATPISGALRPEEALAGLLAGTGFTFERVDAATFRIVHTQTLPVGAPVKTNDVIVTASMRPRALDRLASSVSVISESVLEDGGIKDTAQVVSETAGLTITNLGSGRNKLSIRGLSDGAFSGRTQALVGIYLDDTRVAYSTPDPDLRLVDVERLELLRGPQGTLYGAGAIGGLYRIVTKAPDYNERSGSVGASTSTIEGSRPSWAMKGVANFPLIEGRSALRVAVYNQKTVGWLNNRQFALSDINSTTRAGARASLGFRLGETWTLTGRAATQQIKSDDSQYVDMNWGRNVRSNRVLEPHKSEFDLLSLNAQGRLGVGELSTTASYVSQHLTNRYDASGGLIFLGLPRAQIAAYDDVAHVDAWSLESRYSAVASRFPWHVGMYLAQTSRRFEDAIIDDPSMPTRGVEYDSQRDDLTSEIAIFGDAVFALAPNVELSLAGRYDVSRQAVRATAEGLQADFFHDQVAEKSFSPKVELSFAPRAGDFYYVSGGRGYRHGGFNTGAARIFTGAMQPGRRYGDDEVWSAEVGTKKSFFDEKAHVRAAAFWQDWRNIQTDQLFAAGVPFTGNVGNAQSRGVEIETSLQASEPLQIRLNLAYTDTAITKVDPSFPARLRAGLPGAPHVSAGLAVDYKKSLANELNFGAFLRAWYVGESSLAFTRTRELSIGDYADVDGRVKLECADWTAALFVNNALNARSATYSYGNPIRFGGAGMITPLRPRMFGMELSKNF